MATQEALDLIARYDRLLERYEGETIARVNEALLQSLRQIESQLRLNYPSLLDANMIRRQAMIAQQLGPLLDVTRNTQQHKRAINNLITEASGLGSESVVEMVSLFDDEMGQQMSAFADVPIEAIAAQADGAVDRLKSHGADFARKASAIIEANIGLGQSIAASIKALRNALGLTRFKAQQIARTETIGAFDRAAQDRYEEAGLFSQVFSVGDRRVCPYCAHRNGRVYKTKDISIPLHVSDRCYRVPWSRDWAKAGLIDEEFVNRYAAEGLAALRAEGKSPDGGLAPFEKMNGRRSAPKPVWSPGDT